ncbi:hypothetical protein DL768_004382 [Monosporascus sp. mg162]|nr:hypothetical protein DL768_004382 [Monosporascus sp. mg162]
MAVHNLNLRRRNSIQGVIVQDHRYSDGPLEFTVEFGRCPRAHRRRCRIVPRHGLTSLLLDLEMPRHIRTRHPGACPACCRNAGSVYYCDIAPWPWYLRCVLARAGRRPGVGPLHRLLSSVALPELIAWWHRHERDCAVWECRHRDEWFGTLVFWAGLAVATLLNSELAELYRGLWCDRACGDGVGSEGNVNDGALADIIADVLEKVYRWKYPEANFPWGEEF